MCKSVGVENSKCPIGTFRKIIGKQLHCWFLVLGHEALVSIAC